jgi:hypothetical protein
VENEYWPHIRPARARSGSLLSGTDLPRPSYSPANTNQAGRSTSGHTATLQAHCVDVKKILPQTKESPALKRRLSCYSRRAQVEPCRHRPKRTRPATRPPSGYRLCTRPTRASLSALDVRPISGQRRHDVRTTSNGRRDAAQGETGSR